ncbi:MAG: type II toxin-antitoxin system HicB family antitoxin [Advenella sp.]|uniref:type II toxin-antitoxin system HicB family antitoxin n=1 Tax=Advenella sp. TaxID=1872388 RepID=UPI003F9C0647
MNVKHYTYRVSWSPEDQEHIGLCAELPSLSWLASDPAQALAGIMQVVAEAVQDMQRNGEVVPSPIADKRYSGQFRVRVPPLVHRNLAIAAAEQGVSMNRFVSAKLAG